MICAVSELRDLLKPLWATPDQVPQQPWLDIPLYWPDRSCAKKHNMSMSVHSKSTSLRANSMKMQAQRKRVWNHPVKPSLSPPLTWVIKGTHISLSEASNLQHLNAEQLFPGFSALPSPSCVLATAETQLSLPTDYNDNRGNLNKWMNKTGVKLSGFGQNVYLYVVL